MLIDAILHIIFICFGK